MFRKYERTPMRCSVILVHQQTGEYEVVTHDVSSSGLFVNPLAAESEMFLQSLHIGDEVQARMETPDDHEEALPLRVARIAPDGLGLAFA